MFLTQSQVKTRKKEKTTIKGNFDKDVEVELDKTVYQYSLRLYETPYATNYNFYTLAHDDIYRKHNSNRYKLLQPTATYQLVYERPYC